MSDEKSVEAAIMDGDIGPHTCRSCCAPTWNDWEVCDECGNEAYDLSDADDLARLRAEVERLRGQAEINNKMVKKTADDVVRYKSRAERAEAALADERAHADVLAEAVEMFATDRNWQQGGPFDPCSPSFTGTAMASALAKQHRARRMRG